MEIIYIALLTIIAASVGTLTGFGTSTIMVPILSLFLPLPQTLLLAGVIHYFGDIWKIVFFREGIRWKLLLFFGIPGIIFTFIGARLVFSIPEILLSRILGGFLIAYSSFLFLKPGFKFRQSAKIAALGGGLYGFFAGIFGVGGAIRGAFLSAFDLPKAVYIATAGAIAIAVDSTRLITYFLSGIKLDKIFLLGFLLFIPASFLGAFIAKKISLKIPQNKFRLVVAAFLFLVGIRLLLIN
ncbi:MAG: sulfite exporter TauE/SafE family protein [Candidatus Nealsonbacteria bacterium]|nr:sulfite exporter TauE/SafE family protein [Candidatus Nealsonbacteria bacterium]